MHLLSKMAFLFPFLLSFGKQLFWVLSGLFLAAPWMSWRMHLVNLLTVRGWKYWRERCIHPHVEECHKAARLTLSPNILCTCPACWRSLDCFLTNKAFDIVKKPLLHTCHILYTVTCFCSDVSNNPKLENLSNSNMAPAPPFPTQGPPELLQWNAPNYQQLFWARSMTSLFKQDCSNRK